MTRYEESALYPWGGEFSMGNYLSPVSVATMAQRLDLPGDRVALWGKVMTENLGVEKLVANVISNPNIRFVILFGKDVRGHRSGETLLALHKYGLGEDNRVLKAPGAMPYIENLDRDAVDRFRSQVDMVNLLNMEDMDELERSIRRCLEDNPGSFGEPHIAIRIKTRCRGMDVMGAGIALYNDMAVDHVGRIVNLREER